MIGIKVAAVVFAMFGAITLTVLLADAAGDWAKRWASGRKIDSLDAEMVASILTSGAGMSIALGVLVWIMDVK